MTPPDDPQNIAVIGDVSGYLKPLTACLEGLGVDIESRNIPAPLTIIQLGDLIHKGPDSDAIVSLVDELMMHNKDRWIQLIGNHEAHHLPDGPRLPERFCDCNSDTHDTLNYWVEDREVGLAAAIVPADSTDESDHILVTHAGMSRDIWLRLGHPMSANSTAGMLDSSLYEEPEIALRAGQMMGLKETPGVAWAAAPTEVYATWLETQDPPFHQIHGHTQPYFWRGNSWSDDMTEALKLRSAIDSKRRFSMTEIGGRAFHAIDPGFTARAVSDSMDAFKVIGRVNKPTIQSDR